MLRACAFCACTRSLGRRSGKTEMATENLEAISCKILLGGGEGSARKNFSGTDSLHKRSDSGAART